MPLYLGALHIVKMKAKTYTVKILTPGPGCSKLTSSLVKVSLKFQTLISEICQYFLLKKCEKLFQQKISVHLVNKS